MESRFFIGTEWKAGVEVVRVTDVRFQKFLFQYEGMLKRVQHDKQWDEIYFTRFTSITQSHG